MKVDKITRDELRKMRVGEVKTFELPHKNAVKSGRVQVSMIKALDRYDFESIDAKDPLMLIYKRTK